MNDTRRSDFRRLFQPQAVAVVGASAGGSGPANNFIRHLTNFGFKGRIYPVHPTAALIEGLPAYRTLAGAPEPIDYAYVAVASDRVESVLVGGAHRVAFAQVISSGFAESAGGEAREQRMLGAARAGGIRVVGPNCLGTHSPRGRMTFLDRARAEAGHVGVLSQSGGLSADIIRRGQVRGVRFSGVVSVGNCADVKLVELLAYLLDDSDTRVIGLYLENAGEARPLFDVLRIARSAKPIVMLKGGRTDEGQGVASSHTGALASDYRLWVGMARQTGAVMVDSVDAFIDTLLALQMLKLHTSRPTRRIVLFGNGGGTSVLATDCFAERGFEIPPFAERAIEALQFIELPPGAMLSNPIDIPANALRHKDGRVAQQVLGIACRHGDPHAIVMHVNMTIVLGYRGSGIVENLLQSAVEVKAAYEGNIHLVLVIRSDGEPDVEEAKREAAASALAAGIPVFDELCDAAVALSGIAVVERFRLAKEAPRDPSGRTTDALLDALP